jgi:hypothetical protein
MRTDHVSGGRLQGIVTPDQPPRLISFSKVFSFALVILLIPDLALLCYVRRAIRVPV